jgi:hypothetical protein
MSDDLERSRPPDANVQLLPEFTMQTFLQGFTGLSFPAGKFPEPAKMRSRLSARDQIASFMRDDPCCDLDEFHGVVR